ncbi:MAG: phosphomannomutase [Sphingopyxis sp.]|nr:phosphomannomutase [Sphingopyxis sp.]
MNALPNELEAAESRPSEGAALKSVRTLMTQSGVPFGTSGVRGPVSAMTDVLCFTYTRAFLQYLRSIGEFAPGQPVALAGDLRPSTPRIVRACAAAVRVAGGVVVNCGLVPTPALAYYALGRNMPSIMVTGSHIPADRNGIKFYRPTGEVLKSDEAGILEQRVSPDDSLFDASGALLSAEPLPPTVEITSAYRDRYVGFFGADALKGMTVGVYQHSAVGRDVLVSVLEALGAVVLPFGRSETFVPVDTEAIRDEDILLAQAWASEHRVDAIVSTDGDSDRPLVADAQGTWLRGDITALLCARALGADRIVTPVSSNTAAELSGAFVGVRRTRIGSPYVIAAMQEEIAADPAAIVCGYEANGGVLLGSTVLDGDHLLDALPTRDAVLPIVSVLAAARRSSVAELVASLPQRATHSDRLPNVAPAQSAALLGWLREGSAEEQRARIETYFGTIGGHVVEIDTTDGLRVTFDRGVVIHLRASGNAPELRCYTEAATAAAAEDLSRCALIILRDDLLPISTPD